MALISYNHQNNEYVFKIILVGDSGVGKTSLLSRYTDNTFDSDHLSTIGVDFKIKNMIIDDKLLKMQVWDTAGQERFKTITASYYRNIVGAIYIYDVSNEKSFDNIARWHNDVTDKNEEKIISILLAHKCELLNKHDTQTKIISRQNGMQLAQELDMRYMEASSKKNIGINEVFDYIAQSIYDEIITPQIKKGIIGPNKNVKMTYDGTVLLDVKDGEKRSCFC